MMDKTSNPPAETPTNVDRRDMLRGGSVGALAAFAATAGLLSSATPANAQGVTDNDILNFALNLEYLEAEYYLRAVTGQGLAASDRTGIGTPGAVTGGRQLKFESQAFQHYALEIAQDEQNHVQFLRSVLGASAVAAPAIDIQNSFDTLAQVLGYPPGFDPYASEVNFLLGAYVFEDVGVTAYLGAAPLVQSKTVLSAAGAILAVEAYHASEIRLQLLQRGFAQPTVQISALRASLSGAADDQGVILNGRGNIVPTDSNSLVFSRTTRQVLNIVYGAANASSGLFFPQGLNGTIK